MKKSVYLIVCLTLFACSKQTQKNDSPVAFDLSNIDTTVHQCHSFYQYAVGNWINQNPIPETESRWAAFDVLAEANKQKLEVILADLIADERIKAGSNKQKIRDFYLSGLDSSKRASLGTKIVQAHLNKINEASTIHELNDVVASLAKIGLRSTVGISIGADQKNSNENIVYASQSGLNLPDNDYYLLDDPKFIKIRKAYVAHIDRMASLFSLDEVKGSAILSFETKLAQMHWSRADRRKPELTYNRYDLVEWSNTLSNFDFTHLCNTHIGAFDTLIVSHPSYFAALDSFYSTIDLGQLKAYTKWNLMRTFAGITSIQVEKESFNFYSTTLKGIAQMKPLNERMYYAVNGHLGEPLGQLYVDAHFDEESKAYVVEMVENLRAAYKKSIQNLEWMSDLTKGKAIRKLEAFTYKIGYPDKWKDYKSVAIDANSYATNVLTIRAFNHQEMLSKLGKAVDKTKWHMNPQRVNAYYSSSNNEIVFPAGILQPPFFHKSFDHAINYGGIGAVIGHEFSHGFDDRGRKFDWDGNFSTWWTSEDSAKFMELASQLGAQYSAYEPTTGFTINGDFTMGENIADLGGLTLAYDALLMVIGDEEPEPIDGFTWKQRFFLGWANVWKGSYKEERLIMQLKSDSHSPGEYRVLGPLVNIPAYYEAFGSCETDNMYKPDSTRIKIW